MHQRHFSDAPAADCQVHWHLRGGPARLSLIPLARGRQNRTKSGAVQLRSRSRSARPGVRPRDRASTRSSYRTARRRCRRLASSPKPPRNSCRKLYRNEELGRIDVILARFVDDPNVAFPTSLTIRQHLIDLTDLEVLHAAVFDAQRERARRLLNSHNLSPENATER